MKLTLIKFILIAFCLSTFTEAVQIEFANNVKDIRPISAVQSRSLDSPLEPMGFKNLAVGDIFIDVDNIPKKIVAITQVGEEIIIETEKPDAEEAFNRLTIPPTPLDFNESYIIPGSEHPGLDIDASSMRASRSSLSHSFTLIWNQKNDYRKSPTRYLSYGEVKIAGTVNLDIDLSVEADWSVWNLSAYALFKGSVTQTLDATLTGTVLGHNAWTQVKLYSLGFNFGGKYGNATFDVYLVTTIDGKMTLELKLHEVYGNSFSLGYKVDFDRKGLGLANKSHSLGHDLTQTFTTDITPSFNAQATLRTGPMARTIISVAGFNIIYMSLWGGLKSNFHGEVHATGPIRYTSGSGITFPTFSGSGSVSAGVFASPSVKMFYGERLFGKSLERSLYSNYYSKTFFTKKF